jgi:pilus assembly protein CpaB
MSPRNIILLAFALVAALGTALLARGWINAERAALTASQKPATAPAVAAQYVLVAKANLPAGRFVKPEDFRWQAWPDGPVPSTYLLRDKRKPEELTGAVVRVGIAVDEPITDARLVKPGDRGFMAAVLDPGMRAVSVAVTATSGISGFVFPGDRVDLLVTHSVRADADTGRKTALVTETVLREVRVVAIDQRADDQNTTPTVVRTVTFEVTPKQAEMVNVARRLGELTLSLRSLSREELQGDVVAMQLEEGDAAEPSEDLKHALVAAGLMPSEKTIAEGRFTTDYEVSRLIGGIHGQSQKVTIMRGAKSVVQSFRNGAAEAEGAGDDAAALPEGGRDAAPEGNP